ncbi:hypothetical protein G3T14_00585 [Methylobacterium sp. BTF04]|uniref:hypothetical protein n=1 Tax=Methylobacterium sp. BTF04 TaxID=2708300 RepID=UPI0013D31D14|nr:hypothetical protein [Methylobacterium sp. BTF04]NEU10624.1 hypothetical protein [Methylobacterium sp. BTF04]
MTENAVRERETSAAAAWLLRGRPEAGRASGEPLVALEAPREFPTTGEVVPAGRRDWSSALDLIHEATAAIRISEERQSELEEELRRTVVQAVERARFLEAQVAAAENRADLAEKRASDAEEWLGRLHDAVVDGFTRKAPRAETSVP